MPTITASLKYREIERALLQEIEAGHWQAGDRLPGEHDLARRFDVAYMTVRQAVTNLVDGGILLRVRGKGTFIVDQTAASKNMSVPMTLLFPEDWQLSDPYYFPELLAGFRQTMEANGHRASVLDYSFVNTLDSLEPGATIACLLIETEHIQLVERLRDAGYRVLALNKYTGRRAIPCVHIDDAFGVEEAIDHLVSLGHERIAFICGKPGNIDAADRHRGFRIAVKKHGLTEAIEVGDGFTEAKGYAATGELLSLRNPPSAVLCASDLAALGAIKAARDNGRFVPHDLSVIGFGDFSVAAYITPGLTTIRQPRFELGQAAAESLIRLTQHGSDEGAIVRPNLVVRESTLPLRSNAVPKIVT